MFDWHFVLIQALAQNLRSIFEEGYYADKVLERSFKNNKKWGKRDRAFLAETTYDMVRFWRLLSAYDEQGFIPKNYYMRWAYYEAWKNKKDAFMFLKSKDHDLGITYSEIERILKTFIASPEEEVSYPDWLCKKLPTPVLKALNAPASVCLRTNTLKTKREDLVKNLTEEGMELAISDDTDLPQALTLKVRKNVFATNSFKDGFFEVQDTASQRVGPLLNPKPGERIADVCAGAGGKTLHLSALMQSKGEVLAGDVHEKKLEQLKLRARRAGASNIRIQLFANSKDYKKHYGKFDGVLIDAPCSGTGVIRRNPDTKWKLHEEELEKLKALQQEILENYTKFLKPKGRFVYATCSLLKEENEDQIEIFLKKHPEFKLEKSFHRRPDLHNEDGFYAALVIKS